LRVAFLSDIHANLPALEAVLEHARDEGFDESYALGDIVGYNGQPNEVIDRLRKANVECVLGNHDWAATDGQPVGFNPFATRGVEYSRQALGPEQRAWLAALPRERVVQRDDARIVMLHGSPRDPLMEYVFPGSPTWLLEELADAADNPDVLAMGHTHLPMRLEHGTLFLNPGSVGQPRDGDPRASYCVLDTAGLATEFHRVSYDVEAAARAVQAAGLPDFLWQRLLRGV
jgi:putative phosphoesterase